MDKQKHAVLISASDDIDANLEECEIDAIELLGDIMALRCFLKREPSEIDGYDLAMDMYLKRIMDFMDQHANDMKTGAYLAIRAYQKSRSQTEADYEEKRG